MTSCAFSIEDALTASRWAEQIRSRGYRVVITPQYREAEEIIEVYIPESAAPTFRVHRASHAILVTDCLGLTLSFATLPDALLAMAPLPKSGEREMLKGTCPAWFPVFSAGTARRADSLWSQACRTALACLPATKHRHCEELLRRGNPGPHAQCLGLCRPGLPRRSRLAMTASNIISKLTRYRTALGVVKSWLPWRELR